MAEERKNNNSSFPFSKKNYILLAIGFGIIMFGFILMAGGGSDNPAEFSEKIFSTRRIVLAPLLVVGGFIFEIYAIMKKCD